MEKGTVRSGLGDFATPTLLGSGQKGHTRGSGGLVWSEAARHGCIARIWAEKRCPPLLPPEGAWRFCLSRKAQRSRPFPLGRDSVRDWMS